MNFQMKNTLKNIDKIKKDLNKLKEYQIQYYYSAGLGFICSSPYFLNFYWIIYIYDNWYQIKTYRNNSLEYSYKEQQYNQYSVIKDILNLINREIQDEFK